jgi:hypothetical protein
MPFLCYPEERSIKIGVLSWTRIHREDGFYCNPFPVPFFLLLSVVVGRKIRSFLGEQLEIGRKKGDKGDIREDGESARRESR